MKGLREVNILYKIPPTMLLALIEENDCIIHDIYDDARIVVECMEEITEGKKLFISRYNSDDAQYIDYQFEIVSVENEIVQKYSTLYTLLLKDNFDNFYADIHKMSKLFDSDNENSIGDIKAFMKDKKEFCDYPYEKDAEFCDNYTEQRSLWFKGMVYDEEYIVILKEVEMAYFFVDFSDYSRIIENGCRNTIDSNLTQGRMGNEGVFIKPFSRVYLGSEFCHKMIPNKIQYKKILEVCLFESFDVTIAFPYLLENEIIYTDELLEIADNIAKENGVTIEIIINDWGMIELVNKYENLTMVLGRLLNKRKKDSRIKYVWKYKENSALLKQNYLNNNSFLEELKHAGIDRFEFENHLLEDELVDGKCSLHFPYYQINSSSFCIMYAKCKNYNKFKQSMVSECPKYCDNYVFLYPNHLSLVGRGNSILGFNNKILISKEDLKNYIKKGIDRLVYSGY